MRVLKGIAALIALAAILVGVPALLMVVGAPLVPAGGWSWSRLMVALTTPDTTGGALLWLITAAAWVAWAVFTVMTVLELVAVVSRQRIRITLPGLGGPQRMIAAMLIAVIGLVSVGAVITPSVAQADAAPPPAAAAGLHAPVDKPTPPAGHTAPATPHSQTPHTTPGKAGAVDARQVKRVTHVVAAGDTLWGISATYLGSGDLFPRVASLNHIRPFDPIAVGQKIVVDVPQAAPGDTIYTVQTGDTLWGIADENLNDPTLCQTIADINGIDLNAHIHTGQRLILPAPATEAVKPAQPPVVAPVTPPASTPVVTTPVVAPSADPGTPTPTASAPTSTAPTASTATASTGSTSSSTAPAATVNSSPAAATDSADEAGSSLVASAAVASVGLLLAAGLITTVNRRRRRQLRQRRIGQRIPLPAEDAQRLETGLIAGQNTPATLTVDSLDLVLRRIAALANVPELTAARVAGDRIDLLLANPAPDAPAGVDVIADGSVWTVHATAIDTVTAGEPAGLGLAPYPALMAIGSDDAGAEILLNLETAGALNVTAADPVEAEAVLAALTMTLVLAPWSQDLNVTLIGDTCPGLVDALDEPRLFNEPTLDGVLTQLEERAAAQRRHLTTAGSSVGQNRVDEQIGDAWIPEVIITSHHVSEADHTRLKNIVDVLPRVAVAAVTSTDQAVTNLTYSITGGRGHLDPLNWDLATHRIPDEIYHQMLNLLQTSASTDTTTAPWWTHTNPDDLNTAADQTAAGDTATEHDIPADGPAAEVADEAAEVETLAPVRPIRRLSLGALTDGIDLTPDAHLTHSNVDDQAADQVDEGAGGLDRNPAGEWDIPVQLHTRIDPSHIDPPTAAGPILTVLGDITLTGHTGTLTTGKSQATMLELLFYIATHPGKSAGQIADSMCRAPSSVKPLISSLRRWLGTSPDGEAYLPAAGTYGDGYRLHPAVTTDWQLLTTLTAGDPRQLDTHTLIQALHLATGKPLQGTPRGSYPYAECARIEMVQTITDIAHTLTERATTNRDITLARWAAAKGLLVDPGSERLLTAQLAAEHAAGDPTEVTRIADQITATLRDHSDDLLPETLTTLKAAGCLR